MTIRETEILAVAEDEPSASAVSWAAVVAGALAAIAASLALMLVGSGIGLTMASPFTSGASAATFAVSGIIWLVVVQWLSSALGGYMAGRLRKRWPGVQADEVTFRDTAHGFLAWALATVVVAGLLTSAVSAIVGGTVSTAANVASGAVAGAAEGATSPGSSVADPTAYFVDTLFRAPPAAPVAETGASESGTPPTATPPAQAPAADMRGEAGRILVQGLASDEMAADDKSYLAGLVARQTGISAADAEKRVNDVIAAAETAKAKAKEAADQARKAAATFAILSALALAVGAFVASVGAVLGGRERDRP